MNYVERKTLIDEAEIEILDFQNKKIQLEIKISLEYKPTHMVLFVDNKKIKSPLILLENTNYEVDFSKIDVYDLTKGASVAIEMTESETGINFLVDKLTFCNPLEEPKLFSLNETKSLFFCEKNKQGVLYVDYKQELLNKIASSVGTANVTKIAYDEEEEKQIIEFLFQSEKEMMGFCFVRIDVKNQNRWINEPVESLGENKFRICFDRLSTIDEPGTYEFSLSLTLNQGEGMIPLRTDYFILKEVSDYCWISGFKWSSSFDICEHQLVVISKYTISTIPIQSIKKDGSKFIIQPSEEWLDAPIDETITLIRRNRNQIVTLPLQKKKDTWVFDLNSIVSSDIEKMFRADLAVSFTHGANHHVYFKLALKTAVNERYFPIESVLNTDLSAMIYINLNKGVSINFHYLQYNLNESYQQKQKVYLKKLTIKNNVLTVKVTYKKVQSVGNALHIHLRKDKIWTTRIFLPEKTKILGEFVNQTFRIDISSVQWEQFYLDLFIRFEEQEKTYFVLISNKNRILKWRLQYSLTHNQYVFPYNDSADGRYQLLPYITLGNTASLNYRIQGKFETIEYKKNEKKAVASYLLYGWWLKRKKIWLIHEKFSETAQDNSFYFFKYMYENHYEKNVYYVIDPHSPDAKRLESMSDRVLDFMSIKHLVYLLASKVIVASETKGHGFSWRTSRGFIKPKLNQKPFIFLQHGVLGLKKIDDTFAAKGMNHAQLFTTSSQIEKKIVKDYLGYKDSELMVTGLPRWDALNRQNNKEKRSILIMPTWRNWLEEVTDQVFIESEYFKKYNQLIHSEKLKNILEKYNLTANLYLHPKFIHYTNLFKNENGRINVIQFGELPVNKLIQESSLLVTDYSSVAWEALYQDIPTVFYQFDQIQYNQMQGAYLDLNKELFGPVCFEQNELLDNIEDALLMGPDEKKMNDYRNKYFAYVDHQNSDRIYQRIMEWEKEYKKEKVFFARVNKLLRRIRMKAKKYIVKIININLKGGCYEETVGRRSK